MKGCIQIYTGEGKGKTTAALGLAFRAVGQNRKVDMIQFLKRGGCGEHKSAALLSGMNIYCGCAVSAPPWNKQAREEWAAHTAEQLKLAKEKLAAQDCDVLILDEILGAMNAHFLTEADVLSLMEAKPEKTELIITGRGATEALIARADLVTCMTKVKHYMDDGLPAREGIEY